MQFGERAVALALGGNGFFDPKAEGRRHAEERSRGAGATPVLEVLVELDVDAAGVSGLRLRDTESLAVSGESLAEGAEPCVVVHVVEGARLLGAHEK